MKVELFYIDDCLNYLETWSILENLLQSEGISTPIEMIRVRTEEEAKRLKFPGSPTIRINGEDVEEQGAENQEYGLYYRRYKSTTGPRAMISRPLIRQAIQKMEESALI